MAQAHKGTPAPRRIVRADDWGPMGGPVLPGEFRPLAPTPAASESGGGPIGTEAELIRQLVHYYRWGWIGDDMLRRYNPHHRAVRAEVEALGHE